MKVLIIDDSRDILEIGKLVLEMNGYQVSTASSGTEALMVLGQLDLPDLILLDMRMEDMSGTEFIIYLEKKMPKVANSVPIVFLTALNEVPSTRAIGFIKKPFDIQNFAALVGQFIAQERE
jgi:CheY-like chemotaxis protein